MSWRVDAVPCCHSWRVRRVGRKRRKRGRFALIGPDEVLAEALTGKVRTAVTDIPSMSNGEEAKLEIDAVVWDPGCPLDA